MKKNNINYRY